MRPPSAGLAHEQALQRARLRDERRLARRRRSRGTAGSCRRSRARRAGRRRETQPARRQTPPTPEPDRLSRAAVICQDSTPATLKSNLAVHDRQRVVIALLARALALAGLASRCRRLPRQQDTGSRVAGDRGQPALRRLSARRATTRARRAIPSSTSCTGCRRRATGYRGVGFVERALDLTGSPRSSSRRRASTRQRDRSGVPRPRPRQPMGHRDHERARRAPSTRASGRSARARDARSIGVSAGGYGAMQLALKHLDQFSVVESWSGYFHPTDPTGTKAARPRLGRARMRRPTCTGSCRRSAKQLRALRTFIAFYVGRERHALLRRERAAEPGAVAGGDPARLPGLSGRPRSGPVAAVCGAVAARSRSITSRRRSGRPYDLGVATTAKPTTLDPRDFLAIDALLDDEERAIRDTVRQFVRDRIVPGRRRVVRAGDPAARAREGDRRSSASSACTSRATACRARAPSRTGSRAWSSRPATRASAASSRCRARSRCSRSGAGAPRSRSSAGCRRCTRATRSAASG